jgi:hypothetical protein
MIVQPAEDAVIPPPAPDYDAIVRVIQLYIDGFNQSDISKFNDCFHENAWWACTLAEDSTLVQHPVADSLEEWVGDSFTKDWEHQILSVTQAGDVASVLLEMHSSSRPEEAWVDIHAMLRINGVWKDMNKTATHAHHAGWAGSTGVAS